MDNTYESSAPGYRAYIKLMESLGLVMTCDTELPWEEKEPQAETAIKVDFKERGNPRRLQEWCGNPTPVRDPDMVVIYDTFYDTAHYYPCLLGANEKEDRRRLLAWNTERLAMDEHLDDAFGQGDPKDPI
jgi:hypothetical protein